MLLGALQGTLWGRLGLSPRDLAESKKATTQIHSHPGGLHDPLSSQIVFYITCSYRNHRHLQGEKFITGQPSLVEATGTEVTGT